MNEAPWKRGKGNKMKKYVLNEKAKEFIREFFAEEFAEDCIEKAETIFNCDQPSCSFSIPMGKDVCDRPTVSDIRLYLNRTECADVIEE